MISDREIIERVNRKTIWACYGLGIKAWDKQGKYLTRVLCRYTRWLQRAEDDMKISVEFETALRDGLLKILEDMATTVRLGL